MDAVRNLEVTFRSLGGGSKEKMQEDWESIDLKKCLSLEFSTTGQRRKEGNGAPSFSQRGGASPLFPPKCNDFRVSYITHTHNRNASFFLTFSQRISA